MLSLVAWPGINCLLSPVGSTSGAMSVRLLRVLRNLELDLISVREQNELFRLLGLVWQRSIHLLLVPALEIFAFVARVGLWRDV